MISMWREAFESRELFSELVRVQLAQRYSGSILGFVWALAVPLLTILSFSVIFSSLNGWKLADYGVYFFCGYVPWSFFQSASLHAAESLVGNAFYVTRLSMPKQLLPLTAVALNGIDALISLALLLALMPALGAPYSAAMLCLPASLLVAAAAVAGVALLCAQANVFIRDFRYVLNSVLFLWFFFSPVLWRPASLTGPMRELYRMNPVVPFVELFQQPIRDGVIPSADTWTLAVAWSAALLAAGSLSFVANSKRFYYYL